MGHALRIIGFVLLLGTCGGQIVRTALAKPVTEPVASDVKKAERVAVSRVGGADLKAPVQGGSAAVIGGNGVVEPAQRETKVAAQVTAVVREVKVVEGQQVSRGDVLVRLDDTVERAAVESAEADLAAEQASLQRTLKGLRVEDRDAVQAEADAAKSRAELAASVLGRTEQLAKTGAVTTDELDRARRAAQTEQASYQATNARLRAAVAGSRSEDIGFQRARVLAAQARVNQAKASLERLTVRSPIDGEVLQVKIREGELYSFQGTEPLVVMGDTRQLRVRMDVDERDISQLAVGAEAYVTADAFGAEKFSGKVLEVGRRFGRKNVRTDDPVEKNDTKILEVIIALDSNLRLVPGQRVTAFVTAVAPK